MRSSTFASVFSMLAVLSSIGLIGYVLLQQRDNIEKLVPELLKAFTSSPPVIQGEIINAAFGLLAFLIYSFSETLDRGIYLMYQLARRIGARAPEEEPPPHPTISPAAMLAVLFVYFIASIAVVARLYQPPPTT